METFFYILAGFIWFRNGMICCRLTGRDTGPVLVKQMYHRYIAGPNSTLTCIVDANVRGAIISLTIAFGYTELTKALIVQTCIIAAGVMTGMQRKRKELHQE